MSPKETFYENNAKNIIEHLKKRQMEGYYYPTAKEAVEKAASYITEGDVVGFGGSMTLFESGLIDYLKTRKDITLLDRGATPPEEMQALFEQNFKADHYFMSTNAITIEGELLNIDGYGNRLASLLFGPKNVVLLVGMNKVAANLEAAYARAKNTAAPANCNRLGKNTPCAVKGHCMDCLSPDSVCSHTVITRRSSTPGRIKIILIGEELGY